MQLKIRNHEMVWPNKQWIMNQLDLNGTLTHNGNNEWEYGGSMNQMDEVNQIKLDQWPYIMKHECKHASRTIKTSHGLWFGSRGLRLCINQESQGKWEVNTSGATKSWASTRVSTTSKKNIWFMNLPDQN